jgi:two-component system sensor histidine kinase KdpD
MTLPAARPVLALASALAAIAGLTAVFVSVLAVSNATTVALSFLLIVLVVAATTRLWVAVAVSIAAMLSFNFFFLPPVGTLTIADPQNWVALFVFLTVSLVASNLSASARARAREALVRRDELARLFDLSRDVLVMTESLGATAALARTIARRFDLPAVAIALPSGADWTVVQGGAEAIALGGDQLSAALAAAGRSLEFDAYARTYAGHQAIPVAGRRIHLVPLRTGTRPIGFLVAAGREIEPGTLDALAGVAAIGIERAQFLDERKAAEVTRQSEQFKTALLASLAHDLRTPLTAIRVAAANMSAAWLDDRGRAEQSEIVLAESERLTRLFENILEMARIDAGAVVTETRWTHASEIIEAAQSQVEQTLRSHRLEVRADDDVAMRLDPRIAASALAHLLENAAQYAPAGTTIEISAGREEGHLTLAVRDHGPGIRPADLPHLFNRFYRGSAASGRAGTGMGLAIARGLLAVVNGRVWAENCADGGARFTIAIPADTRPPQPPEDAAP